ncbi:hypothetical protein [Umezawaea sp. Da 62-37]|uniref:hypothetical protein n=1 Tax=Umezawaea sp. Da 62-37 TaxID=3075927 RepID=UPI0028F720FE|nr:hypothetical protein [Umezawaea sp. Da 62-37]WNV89042.1 hypothetical protein RM788_12285 [Umezawaea sp. Da 62-37]
MAESARVQGLRLPDWKAVAKLRWPAFVGPHIAAGFANGPIASRPRTPLVVVSGRQDRRRPARDPMPDGDAVRVADAAEPVDVIATSTQRTAPLLVDVPITGHSRGAAE